MKQLLLIIISIFISEFLIGQSFEGEITYTVDFNVKEEISEKMGVTKEMILMKLKAEGEFFDEVNIFIKNGDYIKRDNSEIGKKLIYKSDENQIYFFTENSDLVTVVDANKTNPFNIQFGNLQAKLLKEDSTKLINKEVCQLLKIDWSGWGEELYWYSDNYLKINPGLFEEHNYELLNQVLEKTKSYPIEITRNLGEFMTITMTLKRFEEKELNEEIFKLPHLVVSKKKEDKRLEDITGNKIMRIKN